MDIPRALPNRYLHLEGIQAGVPAPSRSRLRDQKVAKKAPVLVQWERQIQRVAATLSKWMSNRYTFVQ